jgi:hypothetical protein
MATEAKQLLTNSRAESYKKCRRREFWEYECQIRRDQDAKPLRMGTAYHEGLDILKQGKGLEAALSAVAEIYALNSLIVPQVEWDYERETVLAMVAGYQWRWHESPLNWVASEASFQVPLVNPDTGARSTLFDLAGKIDGIVKLEDGRLAVGEHKLLSGDISQESDLWRRMQLDAQVSCYVYGARQLGHQVDTVLYDIARKPTIKPTPVAVVDDLGAKIVLDATGRRVKTERGQWRQTGDTAKGYTLQTRDMTPDEWCKKLIADIGERPDYYFARCEVPRLDGDIAEWQAEMWDLQKSLRDSQVNNRWYKTVSFATCPNCPFFALCTQRFNPSGSDSLPEGFAYVENVNPELGIEEV